MGVTSDILIVLLSFVSSPEVVRSKMWSLISFCKRGVGKILPETSFRVSSKYTQDTPQ